MRSLSHSPILNLPLEIVLMIATHLDGCSLLTLTLTCKSFHGLWETHNLPLRLTEKEQLLALLEKDNPFLYCCHYCMKLHRWHGRWNRSIAEWRYESLPCKRRSDNHLILPRYHQIPYYYARLVMNRHLYGYKHGLPLGVLNEPVRTSGRMEGVESSISHHARIVKNQLLIMTVMSMVHIKGSSTSLMSYVNKWGNRVCERLTLGEAYDDFFPRQIPELVRRDASKRSMACNPSFRSCALCPTDYSIEILWQGARQGYRIEVLVYRGLGDCRTPFNWHWSTLSIHHAGEQPRSAHWPDLKPGSVRDQWNEAGRGQKITKGVWQRAT